MHLLALRICTRLRQPALDDSLGHVCARRGHPPLLCAAQVYEAYEAEHAAKENALVRQQAKARAANKKQVRSLS